MSDNVKAKKPRSPAKKTKAVPAPAEMTNELAAEASVSENAKAKKVKKEPDVMTAPVVETKVDVEAANLTSEFLHKRPSAPAHDNEIKVKLSEALYRKLNQQAQEESLAIEELVRELLAESVVLRAWEIIERKNQMRGGSSNNPQTGRPQNSNHNNNNHNRGNNHRKGGHRGGMSQMRYNSIMDDKASFLEYVRNQERTRR